MNYASARKISLAIAVAALMVIPGCGKSSHGGGGPLAAPPPFLSFVSQPTSTTPNTVISPSITVALRDGGGNLIATSTDSVTLSFQSNPGAATLGGTVTRAAVGGVATFDDITVNIANAGYTLKATATGFTNGLSSSFTIALPGATQLVITLQPPSTVAPYEAFSLQVEARNSIGNIDSSFNGPVTVAFGAQPAGDLLLHASGLGDPILELIDTNVPAVVATVNPTVSVGEVSGMLYDPATGVVLVADLFGDLWLLNASTGDVSLFGNTATLSRNYKGLAFNGMGQIRALSPISDEANTINLNTGVDSPTGSLLTFASGTINGANGLSRHPTSGVFYAVLNESSGLFSGRPLATVNMGTGVCTVVGDTGEFVAGLTFGSGGTLYAVTGDGSLTPETLWTVDITTGAMTNLLALGNGNDGESITYIPRRLGGTLTVNAVNGVATFDGLTIDQLGSGYLLTISSAGLSPAPTGSIDVSGAATGTATVSFSAASSSVAEGAGSATVTVTLSGAEAHDVPIMLLIDSLSSTSTAVDDYDFPTAFQVIIPAGQTQVDINIPIVDDALVEGDETIEVVITSSFLSGGPGANTLHTITITDND